MTPRKVEQRRAENEAFMYQPCRFQQYVNLDGSVGKVYPLERGGYVKINDASFISVYEKVESLIVKRNVNFHQHLMQLGVKAYRYNDGWVDRERCRVTFFVDEKSVGAYWGNLDLHVGDKIFLGNLYDGGRFAIITHCEKMYPGLGSRQYGYQPLSQTLDGIDMKGNPSKFLTVLNYQPTFWQRLFGGKPVLRTDICKSLNQIKND